MTTPLIAPMMMILAAVPPGDPDPASGKGPEWGKAAPVGLLIWLLLGVALFLLIKSMNRNLRKVPASFDNAGDTSDGGAGVDGTGTEPGDDEDSGDDGDSGDDDRGDDGGEPAEDADDPDAAGGRVGPDRVARRGLTGPG